MNLPNWNYLFLVTFLAFTIKLSCASKSEISPKPVKKKPLKELTDRSLINPQGNTIKTRFLLPIGFSRITTQKNTYADYLQHLPLKPDGTKVKYFNGTTKEANHVYVGVVDMDIGHRDLQQCADAVMRLRAEYLWQEKAYNDIHFNFTNGFQVDYSKWMDGYRMRIKGNQTTWYKAKAPSNTYKDFRKYMDLIFAYAGTLSLSKELKKVPVEMMQIGDIFIQGGSPGHAVLIVDMAVNETTSEKLFLIAQSYMPAQDIQILQNPNKASISPWYSTNFTSILNTPEWRFQRSDLKRFE